MLKNLKIVRPQFLSWIGLIICLVVGGCFGSEHPNPARYEYLFVDGKFQPPYQSFPQGPDRMEWTCFDDKAQKEFNCTMVRGGWAQFKYIYRARR
jgi:hypothetical protein